MTGPDKKRAQNVAKKVLALRLKASDTVCLWKDHRSVADEINLSWGEVRALARAVLNK